MKKKVLALVIDTTLTNDQIEGSKIRLTVYLDPEGDPHGDTADARNVRVLDSDEIVSPSQDEAPTPEGDAEAIGEAFALMNCMILCGESHSPKSETTLAAARAAIARLG